MIIRTIVPSSGVFLFAALAMILRRDRRLVRAFKNAGAVDEASAAPPESIDAPQGLAWRRLTRAAILRTTPDGKVYLDVPSLDASTARRQRVALVMGVVVLTMAVALYVSTMPKG